MAGQDGQYKPGQLGKGHNRIARDLDRAFSIGRFDPLQVLLIQQARELSWTAATMAGSDEPFAFRINVAELARMLECNRSWLSKQLRDLVKCEVFSRLEDDTFLIQKDFRKWKRLVAGKLVDRLTDGQVAWCLEVVRKGRAERRTAHMVSGAPLTPVQSTAHMVSGAPLTPVQSTAHPKATPPGTPSRTRASEEFQKSIRVSEECVEKEHPHTRANETPALRSPEDAELVRKAEGMLAADLRTEHLALELGRQHNTPGGLEIAGWKWVRAVERLLAPSVPDSKRRSWPYLFAIARGLTEADREEKAPPKVSASRRRHEDLVATLARRFAPPKEEATDGPS